MDKSNQLREAVNEFYKIQKQYSNVGALDTEPGSTFRSLISKALAGKEFQIPLNQFYSSEAEYWQLYTASNDIDPVLLNEAATALTEAAKTVCAIILESAKVINLAKSIY